MEGLIPPVLERTESVIPVYEKDDKEEQIEETPEETQAEKDLRILKERAMKCKVIALEDLGHHPLSNPSTFSKRDKKKVLDKMTLWFNKEDGEIDEEFNDIVLDKVFSSNDDYTRYNIDGGRVGVPELPPDMMVRDVAGNYIESSKINEQIKATNENIMSAK